jgi:putative peptidoglycan lipid II flippase
MGPLAQVGLALATSIGAWINLGLVLWFAHRAGHLAIDDRLRQSALKLAAAGLVMAAVLWLGYGPVAQLVAPLHRLRDLATLIVLGTIASGIYGAIVLTIFGRDWLKRFRALVRR